MMGYYSQMEILEQSYKTLMDEVENVVFEYTDTWEGMSSDEKLWLITGMYAFQSAFMENIAENEDEMKEEKE